MEKNAFGNVAAIVKFTITKRQIENKCELGEKQAQLHDRRMLNNV